MRSLRDATCELIVVDLDDSWIPLGSETVVGLNDKRVSEGTAEIASSASATLEPADLAFFVGTHVAHNLLVTGDAGEVTLLAAGLVALGDLAGLSPDDGEPDLIAITRASPGDRPDEEPFLTRAVLTLRSPAAAAHLSSRAGDWRTAKGALDATALRFNSTILREPAALLGADRAPAAGLVLGHEGQGRLTIDGADAVGIDLTRFDTTRPWLLDPNADRLPSLRLSEHTALRSLISELVTDSEQPAPSPSSSTSVSPSDTLRAALRQAESLGEPVPSLLADGKALHSWAIETIPPTHPRPVARYLAAIRASRPDLVNAFPEVPGKDSARLARWAQDHGTAARFDPDLLTAAAERTLAAGARPARVAPGPRSDGVNLVGYLAGELGLGVSARLMDAALEAAGVPTRTIDVSSGLMHRTTARFRETEDTAFNTTLVCVNGPQWRDVLRQVRPIVRGTHRIGMWYWELEEFPKSQRGGFGAVDEIWAPTDFIRDAIVAADPGVPVRTVMPPLPQRDPDEVLPPLPERFGIAPERPYFLFTFDYLSLADRKNPLGLAEAFRRAFPHQTDGGPLLVIKTINGDAAPADSERLRIDASDRADIRIIDEYLDNHERHVLVANCAAYVSLHRAEGLGLTIAEAMAWGKPVIVTAYGGPMQFVTEENCFPVGWQTGTIARTTGPYLEGTRWAEPDLDEAALLLRRVLDEPELAAERGRRAARDIRELHSIEVASARIAAVLHDGFQDRVQAAPDTPAGGGPRPAASGTPARANRLRVRARRAIRRVQP